MENSTSNSFKKLQEEEEGKFPHAPPEVEFQIMGTVRTTKAAGNILELYLSRMIEVLVSLFGGSSINYSSEKDGESDRDSDFSQRGNSKNI